MTNVTTNFRLSEFTKSDTAKIRGIDNTIPQELMPNIELLAIRLEQVRKLLGNPIIITSGYRCEELNKAVGGSPNSDHIKGLAVDFKVNGMTPKQICEKLANSDILFDKAIQEFGRWVHLSINPCANRKQLLTAVKRDGVTKYINGLV